MKEPDSAVAAWRSRPIAAERTVMRAFGMGAPLGSVTSPLMVPLDWARSGSVAASSSRIRCDMELLLGGKWITRGGRSSRGVPVCVQGLPPDFRYFVNDWWDQ